MSTPTNDIESSPLLVDRHPGTVHLAKYFSFEHLPVGSPERAAAVECYRLAGAMIHDLPDGPELTAGLRKLLEAKDCFVRSALR